MNDSPRLEVHEEYQTILEAILAALNEIPCNLAKAFRLVHQGSAQPGAGKEAAAVRSPMAARLSVAKEQAQ